MIVIVKSKLGRLSRALSHAFFMLFLSEIPGFLTEEECRVVVQLAQLKGLMESQTTASTLEPDGSDQPLLSLSTQEVFSLLDLNQDGFIQKEEVKGSFFYTNN